MKSKRITLLFGHYGSGKTFVAVNYALWLNRNKKPVTIYDLDIVNPYFRTIDAKKTLDEHGIELVVSPFAETNVDIPAMNASSYKMVDDLSRYAVVDVGGDDRGALALGRFCEKIVYEDNFDALWVLNKFRPETRDVEGALSIMREISIASKIPFTGIVNNSNLGDLTTKEVILEGLDFSKEVSSITGIPLKFTSVREDLVTKELEEQIGKILPVKPIKYGNWL
jgi:signal recognition particle receptor subunit beta